MGSLSAKCNHLNALRINKSLKFLPFVLICILGFSIYANSLHHSFQFDDRIYILNNPKIQNIRDIRAIWHSLSHPSRFVAFYSFAWNYHVHQHHVLGYHIVNILIHIFNAMLVFWFARLVLNTPGISSGITHQNKFAISFIASLLFLSHPIQTQAVTYIVQRFTSLAVFFYLLTVCLYIQARLHKDGIVRISLFAGAAISALLGMFTKQIVFTLPFAVVLIEIYFLRGDQSTKEREHRQKTFPQWLFFVPVLLFAFIIPSFFKFDVFGVLAASQRSGSNEQDIITSGTYFLTQFRVIPTYLKLFFLPFKQNVYYYFALSQSFFEGKTILGFLFLSTIFIFAIRIYNRHRLISFGIIWFFLTLSVESSIIPIHHVIFEHRLYLPSVGLCLLLGVVINHWCQDNKKLIIISGVIILTLSYLTIQRNKVWMTEIKLWEDIVKKSPLMERAHNNLGTAYFSIGDYDSALKSFQRATELNPKYASAFNNRGTVYLFKGEHELSLNDLTTAIKLKPRYAEAYSNLGKLYQQKKEYRESLVNLNKAIELNPKRAQTYDSRGIVYGEMGQFDRALSDFNKAIELKPDFADSYNNKGVLYLRQNQFELALENFNRAVFLKPLLVEAIKNQGDTYQQLGDLDRAIKAYDSALKINPRKVMLYHTKGVLLGKQGKYDLALTEFQKAIHLHPNNAEGYNNLGLIYYRRKQYNSALSAYNKALKIYPEYKIALYNRSLVYHAVGNIDLAIEDAIHAKTLGYRVEKGYLDMLKKLQSPKQID